MRLINYNDLSFDWDEGNMTKNPLSHGVDLYESEEVFFNRPLVLNDPTHSKAEPRYWALGVTNAERMLHITFTYRGKEIRVISARDMSKKERTVYEKFKKDSKI